MKIKIYENGILREEFYEDGFVFYVRYKDINILNIGDGRFSPCTTREIYVGGDPIRLRITTSPDLADIMEIINRFDGLNVVSVENGNAKLEITV
jgi:hypothetical protein